MSAVESEPSAIDPPPFLATWRGVYVGVLIYLALLITTLYLLTAAFRY